MSDVIVHFVTSASIGTVLDLETSKILAGKIPMNKSIATKVLFYGLCGIAVDLDHIFSIFQIDSVLNILSRYSINHHRPFHQISFVFSLLLIILLAVTQRRLKSTKLIPFYTLLAGISGSIISHYFFDYFLSCYIKGFGITCFLTNPNNGAKIFQIFK